jgi:hypothetical protein
MQSTGFRIQSPALKKKKAKNGRKEGMGEGGREERKEGKEGRK